MAESVQAADGNELLARLGRTARLIQRLSTWGAGVALVIGLVTLAAVWPWLPGPTGAPFLVTAAVVGVLIVPPLRVGWHGQRIRAVYGDSIHIEQALEAVPGALDDAVAALRAVGEPHGWGPRRWLATWRTVQALQDIWEESPAIERLNVLVEPVHPDTLGLTMVAVWACAAVTALGLPVSFVSLVALTLT
jgi:hypothetical protein